LRLHRYTNYLSQTVGSKVSKTMAEEVSRTVDWLPAGALKVPLGIQLHPGAAHKQHAHAYLRRCACVQVFKHPASVLRVCSGHLPVSLRSVRQPALVRRPWGRHCVGGSDGAHPLPRAVRPRAAPSAEEGGSRRVRAHPRARERHRRLRPRGGWLDAPVCVLLNCTGIRVVCTPARGHSLAPAPRSTVAIRAGYRDRSRLPAATAGEEHCSQHAGSCDRWMSPPCLSRPGMFHGIITFTYNITYKKDNTLLSHTRTHARTHTCMHTHTHTHTFCIRTWMRHAWAAHARKREPLTESPHRQRHGCGMPVRHVSTLFVSPLLSCSLSLFLFLSCSLALFSFFLPFFLSFSLSDAGVPRARERERESFIKRERDRY
jgi:hypothetical protein